MAPALKKPKTEGKTEVTKALMQKLPDGHQTTRKGEVVPASFYKCYKKCYKCVKVVACRNGLGNAFSHLASCHGGEENVYALYDQTMKERASGNHLKIASLYTKYDYRLLAWITPIVNKNLPLNIVEDKDYRLQSKHYDAGDHKTHFSIKLVSQVIFQLVELVEEMMAKEMAEAKCGAILHDGWSGNVLHFLALFAVYVVWVTGTTAGKESYGQ